MDPVAIALELLELQELPDDAEADRRQRIRAGAA